MLDRLLQDMVVYGTVCPYFDQILGAALQGRHYVTMVPKNPEDLNTLKAHYESIGFQCETKLDLQNTGLNTLRVTFAKSLEEINGEQAGITK